MIRVEWKGQNGKSAFTKDVPPGEIEAVKRSIARDGENPLYRDLVPYINGEQFNPTLYRVEAELAELRIEVRRENATLRAAIAAVNANQENMQADVKGNFDSVGLKLLAIREESEAGAPSERFLDFIQGIVNRTIEANEKARKDGGDHG